MKAAKPVIPRELARRDVDAAIDYYLEEASKKAALGFVDALAKAYGHLARHATTGSPRYAHELGLPGLRSWPIAKYPYLIFYVEHADHIDVWRVLHSQRDIPAWLRDDLSELP